VHLIDRFDLLLANVGQEHPVAVARVPTEADGIAQTGGVDLPEGGARPAHKRVIRRNSIVSVGTVSAPRIDAQDFSLRNSQILRHRGHHTRALFTDHATVTDGDIEQSVVLVAGLCGRVETDLLESMYGIGESEPEHFPSRSLECARGWISRLPLGHHSLCRHLLGVGQVGYLSLRDLRIKRRASLGVGGVKFSSLTELGVESYEDEPV
jgi:hypothetical protein